MIFLWQKQRNFCYDDDDESFDLVNKHLQMQFKKIIKQQEFTDKKLQHLPELYNPSHLPYFSSNKEKKDEITKDIKVVDNEAYTGLRDTNRVYEDKNEKMKEKVTRVELKEQPQLSSDERRLVGDISKLFAFQPSRPTKILVRMNQTQTNRSNMPNSPRENRLDKIEITRLENDKYDKTPNQYANRQLVKQNGHYLKQFKGSQINSERQSSCENESLVNVHHSSENILPPPIQIPIKRFLIARQLSIMFVPDYNYSTSIGMKNPPLLFTKFREKNFKDGLNSATSNCSSDSLRIKDEPLQGERQNNKFIKLMDIQLFQKRKEVQHARAQQLRHANEKLLASHLIQKEQLQINIQVIKKFEKQLKTRIMELQRQVQVEREKVKQLILDIEIKQKSNKSLLKLNQQYLKQNNDLKHKIKEYIKNIHDLKAQLTIKEKTGVQTHAEIPLPVIVEKIKEVKKTKAAYPPLPSFSNLPRANYDRAEPILRKQLTFSQINEGNYINNQFFEANPDYTHHRQDTLSPHNFTKPSEKPQGKLINSKSHGIIRLPERVQDGSSGGRQAHYDLTARSQRNVGIKKNHQNQQPISPTTKNLVRVNKNIHNDASIIIAEKLRDNKSLSSISNLSGKSLSQRVGYVLKPTPKDPNNGILVDYMIQEQPKKLQETQKIIQQGKRQRLKLKRND